jgi:fibro-slime domain-containing protein
MTYYHRLTCGISLACLTFGSLSGIAHAQQAHIMQGRIWDFSSSHPDMETNSGGPIITGQVAHELGSDGKPAWAGSPNAVFSSQEAFDQWYRDVPGVNMSKSYSIDLTESPAGSGRYSFEGQNFFPIDNELLGNEGDKFRDVQGQPRNFHYTMQLAGEFSFRNDSDEFTFIGDDDLWVFFGGKLGIDLGGTHPPATITITGAQLRELGLNPNESYPIDIFFAERQTNGSNFSIQTSFNIQPPESDRVPAGEDIETVAATLAPGEHAERNREYLSPNGEFFLIFQDDGNLVIYRTAGRQFVWGLNLVPDLQLGAIDHVMMSQEGDLVATDNQWASLWAAPTAGAVPGSYALLTDGGTVEVRRPDGTLAWSSDGRQPEEPLEVVSGEEPHEFQEPEAVGALQLEPGQAMEPGEFYVAGDNAVMLPEDGNLSIYAADRETFKWGLNQVDNIPLDDVAEVRLIDDTAIEAVDSNGDRLWAGAIELEDDKLRVRNEHGGLLWEDGKDESGFAIPVSETMHVWVPGIMRMAAYSIHDEQRTDANDADLWFVNIDGDNGNLTQGTAQALRVRFLGYGKVAFVAASGPHAGNFLIAYDDHVAFEKEINSSAVFHVRTPLELADGDFASFESEAFPGEYLRHQGFRLKLDEASHNSESLLRRDATFRLTAVE